MSVREITGWRHFYSGKVRDLYYPENAKLNHLILVVASDRVSAFDQILEPEIPRKGELLTKLTLWWFKQLDCANQLSDEIAVPAELASRAIIAKHLDMFQIECVVRGYLSGSAWKEYQANGTVCGIKLPEGLELGSRLPEPLFTPANKAPLGEHDENITFEQMIQEVGEPYAIQLRDLSLKIYRDAAALAERAGLILADTKFEFGVFPETGEICLADEVLTPDSSRYWSRAAWERGERTESFDKQIVRNWLAANWDQAEGSKPPRLPDEIVRQTSARYAELVEMLTSQSQ